MPYLEGSSGGVRLAPRLRNPARAALTASYRPARRSCARPTRAGRAPATIRLRREGWEGRALQLPCGALAAGAHGCCAAAPAERLKMACGRAPLSVDRCSCAQRARKVRTNAFVNAAADSGWERPCVTSRPAHKPFLLCEHASP
eukprot:308466-Chlamydomonas_euryale.AAC.5